MKKYIVTIITLFFIIAIAIVGYFLYVNIKESKANSSDMLTEKVISEIEYLGDNIIYVMNELNNISYTNYKIVSEEIEDSSSDENSSSSKNDSGQGGSESSGEQSDFEQREANKKGNTITTTNMATANNILNDGSTDEESTEVLKNYENDPEIRIIHIENQGLANARNVGAESAKGEFVAFIDADDKIDKTFYQKSIDILHQYTNVSYVYSWVKYFEGSEAVWPTFNTHIPYLLCANMLAAYAVIRKNDFLNFGKNRIKMEYGMEDYDGWVSLAEHGCLGVSIPELLNLYRVRKDSMSRAFNKKMRIYLYQVSRDGHEKIFEKYAKEVYMLLLTNGQPFYWNNPSTPVFLPSGDSNSQVDDRIYRLEKILNTFPGRVARKMYHVAKKIRDKIK